MSSKDFKSPLMTSESPQESKFSASLTSINADDRELPNNIEKLDIKIIDMLIKHPGCSNEAADFILEGNYDEVFSTAVMNSSLDFLKIIHGLTFPSGETVFTYDEATFTNAAKTGKKEIMDWLLENKFPRNDHVYLQTSMRGDIKTLDWLKQNKFPESSLCYIGAFCSKNLKVIEWVAKNNFPVDSTLTAYACRYGTPEILEWLILNKFDTSTAMFEQAILGKNYLCLEWLDCNNYDFDTNLYLAAKEIDDFKIYKILIDNSYFSDPPKDTSIRMNEFSELQQKWLVRNINIKFIDQKDMGNFTDKFGDKFDDVDDDDLEREEMENICNDEDNTCKNDDFIKKINEDCDNDDDSETSDDEFDDIEDEYAAGCVDDN